MLQSSNWHYSNEQVERACFFICASHSSGPYESTLQCRWCEEHEERHAALHALNPAASPSGDVGAWCFLPYATLDRSLAGWQVQLRSLLFRVVALELSKSLSLA